MNGSELLRTFREQRSEQAFAELVRRYTDLVFSVAKRRLNNATLAEETTQSVFLRLAQTAPDLPSEAALVGWLHRTAIHASIDLWRAETRRRAREEKAVAMQSADATPTTSSGLAGEVDEALNELGESDRLALLLRFFSGKKMKELGETLGISEDAAKMRVNRSLERLRDRLALRGIQSSTVLLAAFLSEQAVTAAPAVLVQSIAATKLAPVVRTPWTNLIARVLKPKYAVVVVVTVASLFFLSLRSKDAVSTSRGPEQSAVGQGENATVGTKPEMADTADDTMPNPRKLLEGVARARNRIATGTVELVSTTELNERSVLGIQETNQFRIRATFDGTRRRFEQIGQEYAYAGVGEASERAAGEIRKRKMHRAEAIQEGLLTEFEARYVTAYDGAAVLQYRETDGKPGSATIDDPGKGSSLLFDPRCLGLRAFTTSTLEACLSLTSPNEMTLLGQETIEGTQAWHIEVKFGETSRHYWVNVAQPERLLQVIENGDVLVSRYAAGDVSDPLPIEVVQNARVYVNRLTRGKTEYNIVVAPSFTTLAGLGMRRGTTVIDVRAQRSLGYWTGEGISRDLPRENEADSPKIKTGSLADHLYTLEAEPQSERGLDAAKWVLLNTPDGAEVEKAGDVVFYYHLQSTNLLGLAARLESLRHHCAKRLLKGILANNPDPETRGTACFSLAETAKDEARYGASTNATVEAQALFQRFIREFSASGKTAPSKAFTAKRSIEEIETVYIGHRAPALAGTTLAGDTWDLTEHRGQVVFLTFWSGGYSEAEEHRKLHGKLAGKGVAFVSVNCDSQSTKAMDAVERDQIAWPVIWDGRSGPIASRWHIDSWTSDVLIDKRGTIRHRGLRWGSELADAITALSKE